MCALLDIVGQAVGIAGLEHQLFGPVQVIGEALEAVVVAQEGERPEALGRGAGTLGGHGDDVLLVDRAGDGLAQFLILANVAVHVEGQVGNPGAAHLVQHQIAVVGNIGGLDGGGVHAHVNLAVLQGNEPGGVLRNVTEFEVVGLEIVGIPVLLEFVHGYIVVQNKLVQYIRSAANAAAVVRVFGAGLLRQDGIQRVHNFGQIVYVDGLEH